MKKSHTEMAAALNWINLMIVVNFTEQENLGLSEIITKVTAFK